MSGRASITQLALPTGIKKLTNIAVVRLKKHGVRFEIACYKNTVAAWRDKFEKDMDDVVQTTQIYNNVSKGVLAKEEDLMRAFGTTDEKTICRVILDVGEMQVSDKERKLNFDTLFRDVVNVLVDKCVNPETNRPYPPGMIERALRDVHFSVDPMKSAKQQALAALPKLGAVFPIKRAAMRFRMTAPKAREEATDALLKAHDAVVERRRDVAGVGASGEDEDAASGGRKTSRADGGGGGGGAGSFEVTFTSDPSAYRVFDKHVREGCDGGGRLEVVTMAVMEGGASGAAASFGALDASASASASRAGGGGGDADADAGAGAFATGAVSSALEAAAGHGHGHGQGQGQGPPRSARPVAPRRRDDGAGLGADAPAAGTTTLYAKGAIVGLPDEHESRRARFAPLDDIQPGWRVELRQKPGSSIVDAVFFSPEDVGYKSFADARREALRSSKHGN